MNAKQQAGLCKTRIIICLVVSLIVILSSALSVFAADGWNDAESSKAAGYYAGDETSIVLMGNGTMYQINSEDASMTDIQFSLQSNGEDYVIHTGDNNYIALQKQDKEKTEDGGVYFALYAEYIGPLDSTDYKEGKQVEFGGQVFGNDYNVVVKYPLAKFFGVDNTDSAITGQFEGAGFDTPEEAVSAYINGWIDNDYNEMLSAFAIESYVDSFDLIYYINRLGTYQTSMVNNGMIPNDNDLARTININTRLSNINLMIKSNYLVILNSIDFLESPGLNYNLKDYTSADELIHSIYGDDPNYYLSHLRFDGEFLNPDDLTNGTYNNENNIESRKKQAGYNGLNTTESIIAKLYCDDNPILLIVDVGQFDDQWYILSTGVGNAGIIMGMPVTYGGMYPVSQLKDDIIEIIN